MERAATSSIQMPRSLTRTSAWIGPVASPAARHARATSCRIRSWSASGQPRRRDVEGFLEVGPVQRIGLVEQGERREPPLSSMPSSAYSRPGMKSSMTRPSSRWSRSALDWMARTQLHGLDQRGGIIGADHAPASRQPPRLHHHGKLQLRRQIAADPRRTADDGIADTGTRAPAAAGETPACRARRRTARHGIPRQAEALREQRRKLDARIVHRQHRIQACRRSRAEPTPPPARAGRNAAP